jgi:hypothetical protein
VIPPWMIERIERIERERPEPERLWLPLYAPEPEPEPERDEPARGVIVIDIA